MSEHQTTFSLEKCIEKHGVIDGTARWKARQHKWQNTLNSKSPEEKLEMNSKKAVTYVYMRNTYGEVAAAIWIDSKKTMTKEKQIDRLGEERYLQVTKERAIRIFKYARVSKLEKMVVDHIKSLNIEVIQQFRIGEQKYYYFDIHIKNTNILIEVNGGYWHCDPRFYKADFYHHNKKNRAKDIWESDKSKIQYATENGYKVLVVWEHDLKTKKRFTDTINSLIAEVHNAIEENKDR